MSYLHMKEIWTPLRFFYIRLYKCEENEAYYIKIGKGKRRRIWGARVQPKKEGV